jgi:hypothetical protein
MRLARTLSIYALTKLKYRYFLANLLVSYFSMSLYSIPFYNALLRKELFKEKDKVKYATYSHVLVYGAISIHSQGELGCIASNETIAKEVGMSAGTVANAISDLHKAGWLKVVMRSASMRSKIHPLLGICVLDGSSASSDSEASSLENESASSHNEARIIVGLNTLHSTMNIDNNINNNLDNSKENSKLSDWQAVVLYFYEKISPETPPKLRFMKGTKEAAIHLLSLHSLDEIKLKIDCLSVSPEKKFAMNIGAFSRRYSTIKLIPSKISPVKVLTNDAELNSFL